MLYAIFLTFVQGCAFGVGCTLTIGTLNALAGKRKSDNVRVIEQNDELLAARRETNKHLDQIRYDIVVYTTR